MGFCLSIDPSISNIGVALWEEGLLIDVRTLKLKTSHEPLEVRVERVIEAVASYLWEFGVHSLEITVVERFQGHHGQRMLTMMLCSCAQGALIAFMLQHSHSVITVTKGNEKKKIALDKARERGVKCDDNGADAIRLGELAGLDYGEK